MPIIETHVLEGYSDDEKARLSRALTDAALSVVPAKPDAITVMIHEMPPSHYMRGGTHRDPAPARPDAAATVRAYLAAMEARDLDTAKSMLGDGFVMNFPAAPGMSTLEELIAWSKPRYAFVKKTYDKVEAFQQGETSVVYTIGTLFG